jgi:hypothetical protein
MEYCDNKETCSISYMYVQAVVNPYKKIKIDSIPNTYGTVLLYLRLLLQNSVS